MTPLFPTPDYYLYNLIAMTAPEAKRAWRRAIKEHFGNTCIYCGELYEQHELTLDHVHPRSRGGSDLASNTVCACQACNQKKGSSNWRAFMRTYFGENSLREHIIYSYIN